MAMLTAKDSLAFRSRPGSASSALCRGLACSELNPLDCKFTCYFAHAREFSLLIRKHESLWLFGCVSEQWHVEIYSDVAKPSLIAERFPLMNRDRCYMSLRLAPILF